MTHSLLDSFVQKQVQRAGVQDDHQIKIFSQLHDCLISGCIRFV